MYSFQFISKGGGKMAKFGRRQFVDLLLEELDCNNLNQLALRLGASYQKVHSGQKKGALTKTIVRNVVYLLIENALKASFAPIVEFHPLNHIHGHKLDTLTKKIASKAVVDKLKAQKGIYLFYDSSGSVIYCGRTVKSLLLAEMKQAFNLARPQYKRKFANAQGQFKLQQLTIRDTAHYFSAYRVDDRVSANLEAFVTRIIPNNLINRKTERIS
jgi:hypothetical protein